MDSNAGLAGSRSDYNLMLILAVVEVPVLSEQNTSMEAMFWRAEMRVTIAL